MNNLPSRQHRQVGNSSLDQVVATFDAAWHAAMKGSAPPRLELVLRTIPEAEQATYLQKLLTVELQCRLKHGDKPSRTDYLRRFPAHFETIQAIFEACGTVNFREPPAKKATAKFQEHPDDTAPSTIPPGDKVLEPGTLFGNYTILRLIGRGGMGAVYEAEHRRMRRKVAIKMISQAALQHPEALQRFHREAQAMARLEHPNIVTAHDADQVGDIHFLVMQYIDGDDLSTAVKSRGPLSVAMALRFLMQTARGLEYAHQEGVVHRDIKPSNLIVARNGVVKILDMGLARLEESLTEASSANRNLTQAGNIMGTVDFMAPEQALDAKDADQRADIYSLGCTFYYLLTGKTVYPGDTAMKRIMAHRCDPIPSLRAARPDAPVWLEAVFEKMIAKDKADRYQSMSEVLDSMAPHVSSGLSGPEADASVPGHRSLYDDLSLVRPVAALLVEVPGADRQAPDVTAEQTSPSSAFDTQMKGNAGGLAFPADKPVLAAKTAPMTKATPAKNAAAFGHEVHPHEPVVQEAASPGVVSHEAVTPEADALVENVSWRPLRTAKESGGATSRKRRHRLLGAVAVYVGLMIAVAAGLCVIYVQTNTGTCVIDAAADVKTALAGKGIGLHNGKTGRGLMLQPGSYELPSGQYEIDDAWLPLGIDIEPKKFTLQRGVTKTLRVTLSTPK
jgi:serine/threonine protein kinase